MFPKYDDILESLEYEIYKDLNTGCTLEGKLQHKFNELNVTYSILPLRLLLELVLRVSRLIKRKRELDC